MSFSQIIFQKDLYSLNREDVETFFSQEQEENSVLEFKEGSIDVTALHSEVAAFLNSEGGLIIVGAPREKELEGKKGYKVASGALTPVTKIRDRDVIMRSLGTGIAPAPTSVKIHEILIEGGSIYILDIAQSHTPPHQVISSGKYYIRLEREAKAAPHGIVEALFYRRQVPQVNVIPVVTPTNKSGLELNVILELTNSSRVTAHNVGYTATFFNTLQIEQPNKQHVVIKGEIGEITEYLADRILVKGMELKASYNVKRTAPAGVMVIAAYARDCELVSDYYVIDHKGDILFSEREEEGQQDSLMSRLTPVYSSANRAAFLSLLGLPEDIEHKSCPNPGDLLKKKYDVAMPQSFFLFYKYIDGYEGPLGNLSIRLYNFETLLNPGNWLVVTPDAFSVRVGRIEHSDITMSYSDGKGTFRIGLNLAGNETNVFLGNSFYAMLSKIKEHHTSSHFNLK